MIRCLLTLLFLAVFGSSFAQDERPRVSIETDSGNIVVELFNETPQHRDNFLKLVSDGFYDSTAFHRVIENFMIQGGDPYSKPNGTGRPGTGGPGYTVPAEFNPNFYHQKGALCAARQPDNMNPKRASSGSQFYIVQGKTFKENQLQQLEQRIDSDTRNSLMRAFFSAPENSAYLDRVRKAQQEQNDAAVKDIMDEIAPIIDARMDEKRFHYTDEQKKVYTTVGGYPPLDMQYTVFGQVVEGMDVIDKIASIPKNGETPITPSRMRMTVLD